MLQVHRQSLHDPGALFVFPCRPAALANGILEFTVRILEVTVRVPPQRDLSDRYRAKAMNTHVFFLELTMSPDDVVVAIDASLIDVSGTVLGEL